jgi:hypothetical protein
MNWLLSLFTFIFLGACSGTYLEHSVHSGHQDQQMMEAINRKLKESAYSYRLTVKQSGQVQIFTGKQQGENWVIHEPKQKLEMERKGDRIWIHFAGKQEEMSTKQAGLVSPRDHLLLIKEIAKAFHPLKAENNYRRYRVEIDQHKWLQKLKQRLYTKEETPLFDLSEKMRVDYQLLFSENGTKLKRVTLTIEGYDPDREQVLTYSF